jgi:hypothetical protein
MLQSGPKVFESIFRHLIAKPRSPIIVHCTAGKDRTGVFIMLLFGLCGVDDEVIAREYELTNLGYWGKLLKTSKVVGDTHMLTVMPCTCFIFRIGGAAC